MIHLRDTFAQTLAGLPRLDGEFSPKVSLGTGEVSLADLPQESLRRFLADAAVDEHGADSKLEAAYLVGTLAYSLAAPLVALVLRGQWLCQGHAAGVGLTPRFVTWKEDGDSGVEQVFDIALDRTHLTFSHEARPMRFAQAVEAIYVNVVTQIHAVTGLSQPALFMLISDSFAYAFLAHGRDLGCIDRAIGYATEAFCTRGTKLFSKKLRFDHITLPEAPDIGDWLRVRGGCCRAYTRPGKPNYCTTCVLRDDDSRTERYRNYLRRTFMKQKTP